MQKLYISFFLAVCTVAAQTSFWPNSAVPGTQSEPDSASVTLGLRFQATVPGAVTGVRFYKGAMNTGTHVGNLWTASGVKLASVTFAGETASGWQQANFTQPVAITANTTYVISYLAPRGHYADDQGFNWGMLPASPLRIVGTSPGVYGYGSGAFPNASWNSSNYWVDVVFVPAPPAATLSSLTVTPANQTIATGTAQQFAATGSYSDTSTKDLTSQATWNSSTTAVATVSASGLATAGNAGTTTISATQGGVTGSTTLSVQSPVPGTECLSNCSLWASTTVPATPDSGPDSPVELGVKFQADTSGTITGIRFYKASTNTGTHAGSLWDTAGNLLANGVFSDETASGWQQMNFGPGVPIAANTVYVASYHTTAGHYSDDQNGFLLPVDTPPLHAVGGAAGANGVFAYGGGSFPNQTWNGSNYWVDVVFQPGTGGSSSALPPPPATYTLSGLVYGTSAATIGLLGTATVNTKTDTSGNFSFAGLPNGSYSVVPSAAGYTFSPVSASITINGANVGGVDFTAALISQPPPPTAHSVTLNWTASTSPNIQGYNVYRASSAGGPYIKINAALLPGTTYVDNAVTAGTTYYYVTTAVDTTAVESGYSNQAMAVVPTP